MANRYSIYETGTDRPIMIWGTAQECAAALGISPASLYKQIVRTRKGQPPLKYEIIVHEKTDKEDVLL